MVSNNSKNNAAKERNSYKIFMTGALMCTWIVMGMYAEILGPTLIDLKLKLNTEYEQLAGALSARGVGTFPGCIIGGFLIDKLGSYNHAILALTLDVAAVAVLFMPWVASVSYLWLLIFICGFVQSIHNAAGTRISLDIWKDKSASPTILIHLGYGIGSFLAPLYADPFLAEKVENSTRVNETLVSGFSHDIPNFINSTKETFNSSEHFKGLTYVTESKIEYAYAISAIATASMSIPFFIFQILENKYIKQLKDKNHVRGDKVENESSKSVHEAEGKQEKDLTSEIDINQRSEFESKCKNFLQLINPASCSNGRFWYGFSIMFLMFFYFGNAGGGQGLVSQFIRSFSIEQLHFSKTDASLINTSFWISFSLGRFIFFILARWISVQVLIGIETGGAMCSAILMAIFAREGQLALWVLIQLIGFFWGPLWPTGVAWTDYHIKLTGMGMASQMLGAAFGHIYHMRLIGYLYDNIGPYTYLYHVAGSTIFGFILAVALDIIGARHGNRFATNNQENEQDHEVKEDKSQKKEDENEEYKTRL